MKYLTSLTAGMSGSVHLRPASTGQGIKGVPVAGPEPGAWGSWERGQMPAARQEQLHQPSQVIPCALGHRRGIEGAIQLGVRSVGSHLKGLVGSRVTISTWDSMTYCPFMSQSHSCQWAEDIVPCAPCSSVYSFVTGFQGGAMSSPHSGLPGRT